MNVFAKVNEDALIILFIISGLSVLIIIAVGIFRFVHLRKGSRREARTIADPLQLQPATATRSLQINLQAQVTDSQAITLLIEKLREDGATPERQEDALVVLFSGSRREARNWGLEKTRQLPIRILAHVTRDSSGPVLWVRLDDDFGRPPVGGFNDAAYNQYTSAFDRLVVRLERIFQPLTSDRPPPRSPLAAADLRSAPTSTPEVQGDREQPLPVEEFALTPGRRVWLAVIGSTIVILCLAVCYLIYDEAWWQRFPLKALLTAIALTVVGIPTGATLVRQALTLPRIHVVVGPEAGRTHPRF